MAGNNTREKFLFGVEREFLAFYVSRCTFNVVSIETAPSLFCREWSENEAFWV
jgi:hypothetical protein